MANTLTNLTTEIYTALDMVAREPLGFLSASYMNNEVTRAALDQTIRYHVSPTATTKTISPGSTLPTGTAQTFGNGTMSLNKAQAVSMPWTGEEERGQAITGNLNTMMVDQFAQAFRVLSNAVEADVAALYKYAARAYGVCGTTPFSSSVAAINQGRKIVRDNGAPDSDLVAVIDTSAGVNLGSLTQVIASSYGDDAGNTQFRTGRFLPMYGVRVFESGQVKTHTIGTGSTSLAANAAVNATNIVVDATTNFLPGDVVDITGDSNRYVELSDSGTTMVINKPGVQAAASTNTVIASAGTNYTANMLFHRNAVHIATRLPALPPGGDIASERRVVTDPISGLSFDIAVYKEYHQTVTEVGLVWGVKAVKTDFMALILG